MSTPLLPAVLEDPAVERAAATDPEVLARAVAAAWPDAARQMGVDSGVATIDVEAGGAVWATWVTGLGTDYVKVAPALSRALGRLAEALEDEGWAIERHPAGWRVVGWAMTEWRSVIEPGRPRRPCRVVDLDPWHPERVAYHERLRLARLTQREPVAENPKIEGARRRHRAAYGGR